MNELWIIFTILSLIAVGCVIFIVIKSKQANQPNINIESFENNGLINNGSFMNGNSPDNYISHNGNFDIIIFPNIGKSSYVLRKSARNWWRDRKLRSSRSRP